MTKKALVLAGGGSRGSYQVGVWRALRELNWQFDVVTGTSVGALNGALMVQDDYDTAVEMWENISASDVLSIEMDGKIDNLKDFNTKLGLFLGEMAKNGGVDPRPLENILREHVDEERIRRSPIEFGIVTVEYPSLAPRIINKENLPAGELVDYLMASAACFPAMKMRQIGETRYIDGGYYDNLPINLAIEYGAQEIVAVDLEAVGRRKRVTQDGIKLHYIRSKWDLGVFLLFDQETAKRNIQLGYLDTMKEFGKLEGVAYTFQKGETLRNARLLEKQFDLIAVKMDLTVHKYNRLPLQADANARLARLTYGGATKMTSDAAIAAAAETTARVFELSPETVYTFEELNTALEERCRALHGEQLVQLREKLEKVKKPSDLMDAIKLIDRRTVAVFCLAELRRSYREGTPLHPLLVLGTVVPDELIAGLYLLVLELAQNSAQICRPAE